MGAGKAIGSLTKVSFISFLRWFRRHYYIFFFIILTLPIIISSIQTAVELGNPVYPFTELGLYIFNSDAGLDNIVNQLREDPSQLLNGEPNGFFNSIKYYWSVSILVYKIFGYLFAISIPFFLIYKFFRYKGEKGAESSKAKNLSATLLVGTIFIFIFNLILIIVGLLDGSSPFIINQNADIYQKVFFIILKAIPFHGVFNLILYIVGIPFPGTSIILPII